MNRVVVCWCLARVDFGKFGTTDGWKSIPSMCQYLRVKETFEAARCVPPHKLNLTEFVSVFFFFRGGPSTPRTFCKQYPLRKGTFPAQAQSITRTGSHAFSNFLAWLKRRRQKTRRIVMVNSLVCDKHNRTQGARRQDTILVCRSRARPKPARAGRWKRWQPSSRWRTWELWSHRVSSGSQNNCTKWSCRNENTEGHDGNLHVCSSLFDDVNNTDENYYVNEDFDHALRKGDRSPSDEVSVTSARFYCRQHQLTCFTCCQSVQSHIWHHAPAWLKSRSTLSALRPKTFTPHLIAQCRTPCRTWHHARALLLHLFLNQSPSELNNPAKINGHSSVAPWRNYHPLKIMSSTGLLKLGITGTSPETVSSLNTRI